MNRKYIMALLSAMLILPFFSCEDTSEMVMEETPIVAYTSVRSPQEAMEIALNANSMLMESSKHTRSANKVRTIDDEQNPIIVRQEAARLTRSAFSSDTLLYIFNYSNNDGFAIVSANRSTEGLLAVADSGHIESITNIENPGLAMFVERAQDYVRAFPDTTNVPIPSLTKTTIDTIQYNVKEPKLEVAWGQNTTESQFYPNGIIGCGPLAVFEILSYFEYPNFVDITYANRDVNTIVLQPMHWMNMKTRHSSGSTCHGKCGDELHLRMGRLCREIGERCNVECDSNYSYTTMEGLITGMRSFGFTVSNEMPYYRSCLANILNDNNIILITGNTSSNKGHAWVMDGCIYYRIRTNEYVREGRNWVLTNTSSISSNYNHFNWGYKGDGNGYFLDGVFDYHNQASITRNSGDEYDYSQNVSFVTISR